jgi:hypothetical protein
MRITNHPIVGRVNWQPDAGGTIRLLNNWESDHIVTVDIPELKGVPTFNGTFSGRVRFYRGAAEQLKAAWKEAGERGLVARVLFWSGSFVPRMVRGSTKTPSNHTFGTAFDINHQWNGLGVTPPPSGLRGSVRELVPIFEKHGFLWGGNFQRRKDGMHFEVARLGPFREEVAPSAVEIFVNERQEVVPALLLENRTWVGVRDVVRVLGGRITGFAAKPFAVSVQVHETTVELQGQNIGGIGYVPFQELNALYGVPFQFSKDPLQLKITQARR